MEDFHRSKIEKSLDNLVSWTDYFKIKEELLKKEVFTAVMFDIIEQDNKNDEAVLLRETYKKLTHRGPTAFRKFLEILKENKYEEAYKLMSSPNLNPAQTYGSAVKVDDKFLSISGTKEYCRQNSNAPVSPNKDFGDKLNNNVTEETDGVSPSKIKPRVKPKLKPYTELTAFKLRDIEVKRSKADGSHSLVSVYRMKSKPRGVFFFVNIIEFQDPYSIRLGAQNDRENLVTLFREMNFRIFYYENLTKAELHDLLRQLIKSEYLHHVDSFFMCIQTHGDLLNNQTVMEFSDRSYEYTDAITSMFSNVNCPILYNKPKVFFFPFCRGKISDKLKNISIPKVIETDGQQMNILAPTYSDQLICYGTIPGFMTHRDTENGSWYVCELCKVFANHAWECHLEDLLKIVGANTQNYQETEGRTQVASTESRGFNSLLFLNP